MKNISNFFLGKSGMNYDFFFLEKKKKKKKKKNYHLGMLELFS